MLQLPLQERWQLVQKVLASIQNETVTSPTLFSEDSEFQHIYYRAGSSGQVSPAIKGTGIRVQTLAIAAEQWHWKPSRLAKEYDLSDAQVSEALKFYELHKAEIDESIAAEMALEAANVPG